MGRDADGGVRAPWGGDQDLDSFSHEVIIHDETAADVAADIFDEAESGALIGADGGCIVFVDPQVDGVAVQLFSALVDPLKGDSTDAASVHFRQEVELVDEEDALGVTLKGKVTDGAVTCRLDEGIPDAFGLHLARHGRRLIPDAEHVIDLCLRDDAGVVSMPDFVTEALDDGQFLVGDAAHADGQGGGLGFA